MLKYSAFFRQRSAIFLDSYKVAQIQKDWNEKTFLRHNIQKIRIDNHIRLKTLNLL